MGWTDSHLHHFTTGRDRTVAPFLTDFDEEEGDEGINERDVRLDQTLRAIGDRLYYEYDFGDGWGHTIKLEAVNEIDPESPAARLIDGRRACPPEDCGGIGGYHQILELLVHEGPLDDEQQEVLEWLPMDYDPTEFDVQATDELVQLTLNGPRTLIVDRPVDESLADLIGHSPRSPATPLSQLVAAAGLSDEARPDEHERAAMVRPWLHLLELVGDGIALTQAGYLRPADVTVLAEPMNLPAWMGKANREEHCRPVAMLRETAVELGLVRKLKGRLVPTAKGRTLAGDPDGLWDWLVLRLPLGRSDAERQAGAVALLAVSTGEPAGDGIRRLGPTVLAEAGWRLEDGDLDEWTSYDAARSTLHVLDLTGASPQFVRDAPVTESGRQLARAALRAPSRQKPSTPRPAAHRHDPLRLRDPGSAWRPRRTRPVAPPRGGRCPDAADAHPRPSPPPPDAGLPADVGPRDRALRPVDPSRLRRASGRLRGPRLLPPEPLLARPGPERRAPASTGGRRRSRPPGRRPAPPLRARRLGPPPHPGPAPAPARPPRGRQDGLRRPPPARNPDRPRPDRHQHRHANHLAPSSS